MQAVEDEGNRKIAVLEAQMATATAESKALLEERLAQVRGEYGRRTQRLQEVIAAVRLRHDISGDWWLALGGVASVAFGILLMRTVVGVGTPRGLQGRLAALLALVIALWTHVANFWRDRWTPSADHRSQFAPHHRFEQLPVNLSEGVLNLGAYSGAILSLSKGRPDHFSKL